MIAARGSSDNGRATRSTSSASGLALPVALAAPSLETLYGAAAVPHHGEALVIGISQSGRSPDIVGVVAAARAAGAPTIAITNDGGSAARARRRLPARARRGPGAVGGGDQDVHRVPGGAAALVAELRDEEAGSSRPATRAVAAPARSRRRLRGRRSARRPRRRAARRHRRPRIQLRDGHGDRPEGPRAHGHRREGFSSADLMHGPIAAIAPGTPAVIVAPRGRTLASVLENHRRAAPPRAHSRS